MVIQDMEIHTTSHAAVVYVVCFHNHTTAGFRFDCFLTYVTSVSRRDAARARRAARKPDQSWRLHRSRRHKKLAHSS